MLTPETIKIIIANGEGYNAEFKVRVPPKVRELTEEVCAFANSASDYVLIGVDDSNTIQGAAIDNSKRSAIQNSIHEISPPVSVKIYAVEVDGKTVWVIDVPSGENKLYIFSGAIYVREGANTQKLTTAEEIRSVFQQSGRIFFDDMLYHNFDMETNIDAGNYQDFLRESHINTTLPMEQILSNLRVLDDNNAMKHGGILFFAKNPEDYFFQAVVRCVLFKGTEKIYIIDDKTFCGPLYRQYQQAMMWLQSKMQVEYIIKGTGTRKEIWEIPLTVLKETIINALSHRDYYEKGAVTMVEVFDDRVEISNPGRPAFGCDKKIRHNKYVA